MPTLPEANRSNASWRLVLPGLFCVSFLSESDLRKFRVSTFCGLLMAHLPLSF